MFFLVIRCNKYNSSETFFSNVFHVGSFFKVFALMAAAVLGYDTFSILKYIKELKEQGRAVSKYTASAPTDLQYT